MRNKIVAANWKMNLLKDEALTLFNEFSNFDLPKDKKVMIFSPSIYLDLLQQVNTKFIIGAQNFYPQEKGAFTGEISFSQLKSIGINTVLVGHSERRMIFKEDDIFIREKVDAALSNELQLVYCCGEQLDVREKNEHIQFVKSQLENNLFHLSEEQIKKVVIAYEPVWAIGTGKTATTQQAEEMHAAIRSEIAARYSFDVAQEISILYGGSCNAQNAQELFSCDNIDGGLIGGASLKAADFKAIIEA